MGLVSCLIFTRTSGEIASHYPRKRVKDEVAISPLSGGAFYQKHRSPQFLFPQAEVERENRDMIQTAACEENEKRQESKQGYVLQLHVLLCSVKGSKL